MIPKGVQNADAIIEACKKTLTDLNAKAKPEWKETLNDIISVVENPKMKFFLKTTLAIPITNACLKDATELQSITAKGNLSKFPNVLTQLQVNGQKLLKHAKMEGVTLT